jgi:hypothetical protein
MIEAATPSRFVFIRHMVAAPVGVKIPERFRRGSKQTHTWNVAQWINEFIRTPANSHHVTDKLIPDSVLGLAIAELPAYCDDLLKKAAAQTTEYHRRGKVHVRKQKSTQPILLCVVTSWPEPNMQDTDARREWLALTTATLRAWYQDSLKVGIGHSDEAFYHVHWLVDLGGLPVRRLHAGHAAADAEPVKSMKGEAYRAGTRNMVSEFWEAVGKPLNLQRMSPTPRPRLSRSQAQRNRQLQLENEAAELRKRNAELEKLAKDLAAEQAQHHKNVTQFDADFVEGEEYVNRRLAEIETAEELLKRDRAMAQRTKEEFEEKKLRIEAEASAMWIVIGDAAEKTKAWQQEVRDQLALEARVARVRGMVRPGSGRAGAGSWDDDDLSDVPF